MIFYIDHMIYMLDQNILNPFSLQVVLYLEEDNQTIVLFGHRNWREAVEATAHCSMKWATFLLSLREYVETGKGKPSPHDLKIDNWK